MTELERRLNAVLRQIEVTQSVVDQKPNHAGGSFDNLRRLCLDAKSWAKQVECAAEQGAVVELVNGNAVYRKK